MSPPLPGPTHNNNNNNNNNTNDRSLTSPVREQGWPVQGPTSGSAVANPQNAKTYWNQVGCGELFGKRNVWWYTLYDANTAQTDITFAVVNPDRAQGQKFNLACPA